LSNRQHLNHFIGNRGRRTWRWW